MRNRKVKAMWKGISAAIMCAALTLSAPVVHAQEEQPEGQAEVVEEVENASISVQADEDGFQIVDGVLQKYTGTATEVVIPDGVTGIAYEAFKGCSNLTSVTIPASITSIGSYAFSGCSGITSITIPNGVTSILYGTFEGCSSLTDIIIPGSVTDIIGSAFEDTKWLENKRKDNPLVIVNNILIDARTYEGNAVEIPKGVTSIGDEAFDGCSSLTSIAIPDGVTRIGGAAFRNCSSLTSITLPASVTNIVGEAFHHCSSLTSITIPDGVIVIGVNAFTDCSSLTSITLPDSLKGMGFGAFSGCSGLTSIVIPDSMTVISNAAFSGCSNLTSVTIPASVIEILDNAFNGCDQLTIYGKEGSYAQTYAAENDIPFEIVADSPEEDPSQPSQPGQQEQSSQSTKYEVTVTAGNTSISSASMRELVDINQTKDVVIHSTNGVVFTFPKGTMKMVEGKDSYDFGVKIVTDYAQITSKPFAKDDFAFRINYSYEGNLPGEAVISIPVDSKWIGKTLYYYRASENGAYTYLTKAVVDKNGNYTIRQNHCSDYVAVAKTVDSPKTGDTNMAWFVVLAFVSIAGVFVARRKMMI